MCEFSSAHNTQTHTHSFFYLHPVSCTPSVARFSFHIFLFPCRIASTLIFADLVRYRNQSSMKCNAGNWNVHTTGNRAQKTLHTRALDSWHTSLFDIRKQNQKNRLSMLMCFHSLDRVGVWVVRRRRGANTLQSSWSCVHHAILWTDDGDTVRRKFEWDSWRTTRYRMWI